MNLNVILYQPEIPPNTGNVIRLCANTGASLHLIEPLGFELEDRQLRRAGLDYHEWASVQLWSTLDEYRAKHPASTLYAFSTHHSTTYTDVQFGDNDSLLFGPETRGLPLDIRESLPNEQRLRLPMRPSNRSLNLSNSVAVVVYEAWRQLGFSGQKTPG